MVVADRIELSLPAYQTGFLPLKEATMWLQGRELNSNRLAYEARMGTDPPCHVWHRRKDLNLDKQFWRLSCYRYTTPAFLELP